MQNEETNVQSAPPGKPKGRFRIDLYAKQKRLALNSYLQEKVENNLQVKRLKAKAEYAKRKAESLGEQDRGAETQPSKKMRTAYNESKCDKENTDTLLNLSRTQSYRRRKSTIEALKPLHCSSTSTSNQPVLDGMWSQIVTEMPTAELSEKIRGSKACMSRVVPGIINKKVKDYQNTDDNFNRSIEILYNGGIMKKKKYKKLRKQKSEFMAGVKIPKPVAYDRLQSFINGIDKGEVKDLQEFAASVGKPSVYGVYRPLENFLLILANMYLFLDSHNKILHWFNGNKGKFLVALGADGAPFGKDETATAFEVSFLNILDGIQSCNNVFLLMGANCEETHPLMFEYTKHVCKEMKQIEQKCFEVQGMQISFECKLIPADQKWIASMSGELNNAATYNSSFGNVSKDSLKKVGGTLGNDPDCTWKPWDYEQRVKDAEAVERFKQSKKIGDSGVKNERTKVTAFIASIHSRQEFKPFLDKYVDLVKPDPLHCTNNAWQTWHLDILNTAMKLTDNKDLDKANGNLDSLPNHAPLHRYLNCLESTMKAGRLVKNVRKWFTERKIKGKEVFSYRFTGKESKLFSWHFMHLCKELKNTAGIEKSTFGHIMSLAFSGLCLRNSTALYSRVHITPSDLVSLDRECELYYNCQVLLLAKVTVTTWTIGKAIPYCTRQLYSDLGFGLGLNSMQGREAKHTKLSCYSKNTTSGKSLRWWQIMKHDFMESIWLRMKQPKEISYRRGCVVADVPSPVEKEMYIPSWTNSEDYCYCGLPYRSPATTDCEVCNTDTFRLIKSSCVQGKVDSQYKSMFCG